VKGLYSKVVIAAAGLVALFGISAGNARASVPNVSGKTALYLVHGKSIGSNMGILVSQHESHVSHGSHVSHSSGY
jgi:hypothetical protein